MRCSSHWVVAWQALGTTVSSSPKTRLYSTIRYLGVYFVMKAYRLNSSEMRLILAVAHANISQNWFWYTRDFFDCHSRKNMRKLYMNISWLPQSFFEMNSLCFEQLKPGGCLPSEVSVLLRRTAPYVAETRRRGVRWASKRSFTWPRHPDPITCNAYLTGGWSLVLAQRLPNFLLQVFGRGWWQSHRHQPQPWRFGIQLR